MVKVYCEPKDPARDSLRCLFDGDRIPETATVMSLGLEHGDWSVLIIVCLRVCVCVCVFVCVCLCVYRVKTWDRTNVPDIPNFQEKAYYGKRHELEKTLSNSENAREARQKRRIGGRTRRRGDGGWAVRGATPSGRATLRILRCVATNC